MWSKRSKYYVRIYINWRNSSRIIKIKVSLWLFSWNNNVNRNKTNIFEFVYHVCFVLWRRVPGIGNAYWSELNWCEILKKYVLFNWTLKVPVNATGISQIEHHIKINLPHSHQIWLKFCNPFRKNINSYVSHA